MTAYALHSQRLTEAIAQRAAQVAADWPQLDEAQRARLAPLLAPSSRPAQRQIRRAA